MNKYIKIIIFIIIFTFGIIFVYPKNTEIQNFPNNSEKIEKKEIFSKHYKKAESKLKEMTLEEKVSQMFMVRCPASEQNQLVTEYQPGGYILFAKDFKGKTKQEVIDMIREFQIRSKIPMIISVDEEGGNVCRISTNANLAKNKFKSPQELFKEGGFERIRQDAIEKSRLLLSLGINMNLAPVADVSINENDYIYKRTFGKDAYQTAVYVETVVNAMKTENIACSLKHFPGYGNNKDSHKEVTYDNRSMEEFEKSDFIPFKAGIDNGAQAVLVSHNVVKAIDEKYPASISKKVHEILRTKFDFQGLIMTDELEMNATKNFASVEELAIMAVEAGNDIILTTNFIQQRDAIINAIRNGKISENQIDEAVKRIISYKYYMKLL